jgi:hypothetical protein
MTLENRIILFSKLGDFLKSEESLKQRKDWAYRARNENGWFSEDNVLLAIHNIASAFLSKDIILEFSKNIIETEPKNVGIICAGNIPLVGFHDLLIVLLSGHKVLIKLSSSDTTLMKNIIKKLIEIDADIAPQIEIAERLNAADAFIATGSDNSSRYFEYYFGKKPSVIRKNRSSVAVLTGKETTQELRDFGTDIFQYFGLGCRNISKMFVPKNYIFDTFFESIEYWNTIHIHHKFSNNYDYNKSIYLVNGEKHYDNGFLLVKPDEGLVSPLSVLFYEEYLDEKDLAAKLAKHEDKLQCIVGSDYIPFGQSQTPKIEEFADDVNTVEFLNNLK